MWIELSNVLFNFQHVRQIYCAKGIHCSQIVHVIIYDDGSENGKKEIFSDEKQRDTRFAEIKKLLLEIKL